MTSSDRPLAGLRVLDLSRLIPGPFLTQMLCDLGADVVKVEEPGSGDYARVLAPAVFDALNRGKKSVVVDLKSSEGRATVLRLAASSDALVESFRPGVMDRLGLPDAALEAANPRLVRISLVGYPPGPLRDAPGHDINYAGLAGLLPPGEQPRAAPVVDAAGGLYAAVALLAALHAREGTGRGARVEVSLLEAAAGLSSPELARAAREDGPSPLAGTIPGYRAYACADGASIAVGAIETKFWDALVRAIGRPDLARHRVDPAAIPLFEAVFRERSADAWIETLARAGVPATRVRSAREAAREFVGGPSAPFRLAPRGRAPDLGEHADEI